MLSLKTAIFLFLPLLTSSAPTCPQDWEFYGNDCWYFSFQTLGLDPVQSWTAAESTCQMNGGHLAWFASPAEQDWAYKKVETSNNIRWWIGLNDLNAEGTYNWIGDPITYDDRRSNWLIGEPNNKGDEDCVQMMVDPPLQRGKWNDDSCDRATNYICRAPSAQSAKCPQGWSERPGSDSCYKPSSEAKTWHEADLECKGQGSWLVSVQSQDEETFVEGLVDNSLNKEYYIGYSDTVTPGSFSWVDPSAADNTYTNFKSGTPPKPQYTGSSCVQMTEPNSWMWTVTKCSKPLQFICERGLIGDCPAGWTLLDGKCYEIVINANRVQTWTNAKEECKFIGAEMLKIESDSEQVYFASILEALRGLGHDQLWLGGSDIGSDGNWRWSDGSPIEKYYWQAGYPKNVQSRDDCMTIYTGNNVNNWESGDCFRQLPYVCTVPEGAKLAPSGSGTITIDGKCDEGWRHYNGKCYKFETSSMTFQKSKEFCQQNNGMLTSILDENEQSFLVGHSQQKYWIGLEMGASAYEWNDKSVILFENWGVNATKTLDCVSMKANGDWNDEDCALYRRPLCKKEDNSGIRTIVIQTTVSPDQDKCGGGGWFSDPSSTQCYLINGDQTRTWFDARSACQAAGGDLASINSPDESKFLFSVVQGIPTIANFWIGLIDSNPFPHDILDTADSGWAWSDGSPLPYINWGLGEPNNAGDEDCGEFYTGDSTWNDINCYYHKHYMCEKRGITSSVIGDQGEEEECDANESCCFKHLGAEYGSTLPNSAMTASSEKDHYFGAWRGRLNTPDDIADFENIQKGQGHGGWQPLSQSKDPEPWLQVDFPRPVNVKGVITQGRNGIGQLTDRQWVTKYKVAHSMDHENVGANVQKWEFLSDLDGKPIEFSGNADQNTHVTNIFPRSVVATHMRLYPLEWFDGCIMRLEYIGCNNSCLHPLGMADGFIPDNSITASSSTSGHEAKQARATLQNDFSCLADSNDNGAGYRGFVSKTVTGLNCKDWTDPTNKINPTTNPDAGLRENKCRNPDGKDGPWCYSPDPTKEWEYCDVPTCPSYTPTGWTPSTNAATEWIQVSFKDFFKVSGITLYGTTTTGNYLTSYNIQFSDDGQKFNYYTNQEGFMHIFEGLHDQVTNEESIFREPIATKSLRLIPRTWEGNIVMQFEVMGCYNYERITCADTAKEFDTGLNNDVTIDCPAGCVEDPSSGPVYGGGDVSKQRYAQESAICPAAIHAGRLNNKHGGSVSYALVAGQAQYTGSVNNGIASQAYQTSANSINFEGKVFKCDDAAGWKAWKDHCYYYSPKGVKRTWYEARQECIDMGGDLASINTKGENDFVESVIWQGHREDLEDVDVWIGLNDLDKYNYYQWVDGSPVSYTKWSFNEPDGGDPQCVKFIRLEGYWSDKKCTQQLPYMCKKSKQLMEDTGTGDLPVEEGCDPGWSAYESSCYYVNTDDTIYRYAREICAENKDGAYLVSINDGYEQAFVNSLVSAKLRPGLNYTAWIGFAGRNLDDNMAEIIYEWESKEPVTYTNWNVGQPQTRYECALPFTYKGVTYNECTTDVPSPARQNEPWCSTDAVYKGFWMYCSDKRAVACTYLDPINGKWNVDLCVNDYHFVCEKPRVGYPQPSYTTPDPSLSCPDGWLSDSTSSYCYMVMESLDDADRKTWQESVDYCRHLGADLVSVHSQEEQASVIQAVQRVTVNSYVYFWMGLNNLVPKDGYQWSDGSPTDYYSWGDGEPNNFEGSENCIEGQFYAGVEGWNDIECQSKRNWICKIAKGKSPLAPPTEPPKRGEVDPACGTDQSWVRYQTSYNQDKCYLFNDQSSRLTWAQSNDYCRGQGGQLVAVHSDDESLMLQSWTATSSASSFWIGLRDRGDRTFIWADGSPIDYVNWNAGEPNNYLDSEDCVNIYSDTALWNDENCGASNHFICEKFLSSSSVTVPPTLPQQGYCPGGFTEYGNNCYMSSKEVTMDWTSARAWCNDKGGELASITNEYEQAFLVNFLWGDANNFWIGLTDRNTGYFVWIDQSDYVYTNWQPGEPSGGNENCVEMRITGNVHGEWNDLDCAQQIPFVCSTRKSPQLPTPPATTSPIGCPVGYYSSVGSQACFKLVTTPNTWSAARQACKNEGQGIELASVAELYENDLLFSYFFQQVTTDSLWFGLTFEVDQAAARANYKWTDTWPVTYTNWDAQQPNGEALQAGTGCGRMMNNGRWQVLSNQLQGVNCNTQLPYVCKKILQEIPPPPETPVEDGVCDNDWLFSDGRDCYYVEPGIYTSETKTWAEADFSCKKRGAELASFHSPEEVKQLVDKISPNYHNLYIGLRSNGYEGWTWSDSSPYQYSNWANGEPNGQDGEECVEMYPWDGSWNDVPCYETRGFVCKRPKEYSVCKVAVNERDECGFAGITEDQCVESRGCCWDRTFAGGNITGCFYPSGSGGQPINPVDPSKDDSSTGLSGGAVFGIILALIVVIAAAVFGGIYYKKNYSSKSASVPDTTYNKDQSKGFDNPMAFGSNA